jgi:DNA-directed RNA polymerase specialized sigma24 family protein
LANDPERVKSRVVPNDHDWPADIQLYLRTFGEYLFQFVARHALSQIDAIAAELAKLRIFGGLSVEEAAEALTLSRATAFRTWTYARAWLTAALTDKTGNP